jgi:hypothetical protein
VSQVTLARNRRNSCMQTGLCRVRNRVSGRVLPALRGNGFKAPETEGLKLPLSSCPSRKSYPRILMMQAGQNGRGDNGSASLDRPPQRRILVQ